MWFIMVAWWLAVVSVSAFVPGPSLPDRDDRARRDPGIIAIDKERAMNSVRELTPRASVAFDPVTGTPLGLSAGGGLLTGVRASGINANIVARFRPADSNRVVKAFLEAHQDLFGHGAEVLDDARLVRDYVTARNGLRTIVWHQQVDGIPVFEGIMTASVTQREELAALSSRFLAKPQKAARHGTPHSQDLQASPPISATKALLLALNEIGDSLAESDVTEITAGPQTETETGIEAGVKTRIISRGGAEQGRGFGARVLKGPADVRLVWLPTGPDSLRLCWQVLFFSRTRGEMYLSMVDVETGAVPVRRGLTMHLTPASYRVFTGDSPTPLLPGLSTPSTTQPGVKTRDLVTLAALDTNASPAGWINDGDNQTVGNNVDAHLDANGDNIPDLPRPQGFPNRVFDIPLDLTLAPSTYSSASVVELFFWCNWYHDKLYELGFTEAAGNYQNDTFGRGGIGGDAVIADAQDGSSTDNADFSCPPDGYPGRMQMFIFTGPNPDRDGAFDTTIVLHEYTHGMTGRMVGGGYGLDTIQSAAMAEGWSDFYALSHLSDPNGDLAAPYPMAAYCSYAMANLYQNYYYGMRRYPYCTDKGVNPLTFKDIAPSQAIAHTGIPCSPVIPFSASSASEVHNAGEVWCSMLWDVRAALIRKHGGEVGNRLALELVTDALTLTPAKPNFIQARDAIFSADLVDTGGENYREIWAAFARRGLGFSATSPWSEATAGLYESYDDADDLMITSASASASGPVGGPFSSTYRYWSLMNLGTNALAWSAGGAVSWMALTRSSGCLAPMTSESGFAAYLTSAAYSLAAGSHTNTIYVTNLMSGRVQTRQFVLVVGQVDSFAEVVGDSSFLWNASYMFTPDDSISGYAVCRDSIQDLPVGVSGATRLTLGDDKSTRVTLSGTNTVMLYGSRYSQFYIGSNGYITFGSGDTHNSESYATHFSLPRVSGFLTDLDMTTNGSISWIQLDDRVSVTWLGVPQYGELNSNTFQIELFFDGRIRVSYLELDSQSGVIGLSKGAGIPAGFVVSDFSNYPQCGTVKPGVRILVPASVSRGAGTVSLTVEIVGPLDSDLEVFLNSSNPGLIDPPASVQIPAGQVSVTTRASVAAFTGALTGLSDVLLTASATGASEGEALVVVEDGCSPALALQTPSSAMMGTALSGYVTTDASAQYDLVVRLVSDNTNLLQLPAAVILPAGATTAQFSVSIPSNILSGSTLVSMTALANNWTPATAALLIRKGQANPGGVDMIVWDDFAASYKVNVPFSAHFRVLDNLAQLVTNQISVSFSVLQPGTMGTLLDSVSPASSSAFGFYTFGYQFTPSADLWVTHVRSYGGAKISIWATNQTLLSSTAVRNVAGVWSNTPLATPILLTNGVPYIVGVYTAGGVYAWASNSFPMTFAYGTIDHGVYGGEDVFPAKAASFLYLVDLFYTVSPSSVITVSPDSFSGWLDGIWNGELTLDGAATGLRIVVDDGQGHSAVSRAFDMVDFEPRLSVSLSQNTVKLSWPSSSAGFVLESSTALGSSWSDVTNPPVLNEGRYSITESPVGARFYRLRKP
jgi:hypothetical protein